MQDTFAITVGFIFAASVISAFVRRMRRDKCLKDFEDYYVELECGGGLKRSGKLCVGHTGMELMYGGESDGGREKSYILYKGEYGNIWSLVRFHSELDEADRRRRDEDLRKTYHPGFFRRSGRKIANVFKTFRDAVMDVVNLLISHAKKVHPAGVIAGQDKYVGQVKSEVVGGADSAYEPLLERHIGSRVVVEFLRGDKQVKLWGVLKEYTSEFVEMMDVDHEWEDGSGVRKADVVLPRKVGVIRHLGE